jgi:hypothetical protein
VQFGYLELEGFDRIGFRGELGQKVLVCVVVAVVVDGTGGGDSAARGGGLELGVLSLERRNLRFLVMELI